MVDEPEDVEELADEDDTSGMTMTLGPGPSDAELRSIGRIVAYWGRLEHKVFEQTVLSFEESEELPKALHNNLQFTDVLKLWKKRVVDRSEGKKQTVLTRQHAKILHHHQFRAAIVHAMWHWDKADPSVIISQRIAKKQILTTKFTGEDLDGMATALGEILYWLTYPRGTLDRAEEFVSAGGYMSRHFYAMMTGDPNAEQYLPDFVRAALKDAGAG